MRIWDANTGAEIGDPLHGHDDPIYSVAFSPDGTRIVSGSLDETVRIWDATGRAQLQSYDHSVRYPTNSIIYGSTDHNLPTSGSPWGAQTSMDHQYHCNQQSFQGIFFTQPIISF